MPVVDIKQGTKKHHVMNDTWGHLYPKGSSKHRGVIIVATGGGSFNILDRNFPTCGCSPIEYELVGTIAKRIDLDWDKCALYEIECTLWFYKECNNMYLGEEVGRIIKPKIKLLADYSF